MIIYGVTGTREGGTSEQLRVLREQTEVAPPDHAHHGDCIGVDAQFAAMMRDLYGSWIVGHPPTDPKYQAHFPSDETWLPKPYLVRDEDVVVESQHLYALPKEHKEIVRSGTWATIRIARKLERNHTIILPDGGFKVVRYDT